MTIKKTISQTFSITKINEYYETKHKERKGLGLSQIGHPCKKWIWLKYNNHPSKTPSGRVLRLFKLGEIIEEELKKDLLRCGYNVFNAQKEIKFEYDDICLTGHIDGIIEGLRESGQLHLLECKSMADKYFKKVVKEGYENYNPQYKAQIHAYMLGLKIKNAFVTVYNKNTSELYQERIKLKKDWILDVISDVFSVIKSKNIPERMCPNKMWWESKICNYRKECFK